MDIVNAEDIREYVKRWQAINKIEKSELDAATPLKKFKQIAALMFLAHRLGRHTRQRSDQETSEVIQRWNKLRHTYR